VKCMTCVEDDCQPDAAHDWYCERHPEQPMGHGGCRGAGIPECARIHVLLNQIRLLKQEIREAGMVRDEMAFAARRAAATNSTPWFLPTPDAVFGLALFAICFAVMWALQE
jgi:hypothetical protein